MWSRRLAVVLVAMLLVALVATAAPAADAKVPATLERVPGNKVWSYTLFGMMGAFALLLIYRGIRSR